MGEEAEGVGRAGGEWVPGAERTELGADVGGRGLCDRWGGGRGEPSCLLEAMGRFACFKSREKERRPYGVYEGQRRCESS